LSLDDEADAEYLRRPFTNKEGNENSIPADLTSLFGEDTGISPFNSPQAA
jgi:hypothetical protein